MAIAIDDIKSYISNLYGTEIFDELSNEEQNQILFTSYELLRDRYNEHLLSPRAIALQTLYILEGDGEEFEKLKMHGVKSYSVKGVSVTFDGDLISPLVIRLIEGRKTALTGQLI